MASDKQLIKDFKAHCAYVREATSGGFEPGEKAKQERIERAKKDVKFMVEHYFPHYATAECADFHIYFANKVKREQTFKGFAQWGRGLAKSVWVDVLLPFWLFINDEIHFMVLIGDNETKAKVLLSDLQAEFENNKRLIHDFGEEKIVGSWEKGDFKTKSGFIGKSLGMGQSVRGLRIGAQRPDYCVVDDIETKDINKSPKRQDETATWIERQLIPTMDGPTRRFIQANNRFAPRMIQTVLQEKHPGWFVHDVPAYNEVTYKPTWHQKYDDDYYKNLESDDEIGVLAARAEYNNKPHVEGKIFTDEQIQWAKLPRIDHFELIVGHWDVAYAGTPTSDFNAVRVWGLKDGKFYQIDSYVKQSKMKAAIQWMSQYQRSLPKSARIHWRFEAQFWNDEVERTIREVEAEARINLGLVKVDTPKGKKIDRILTLQPYYQNSRIYHNEKNKSHNDSQEGLAQLKGIEPGYSGHDDAPDADQQAIEYLSMFNRSMESPAILGERTHRDSW